MIITTSTMMLVQAIIVTWIMMTTPEPCPQEYLNLGGDVIEYCELTPAGLGNQWSLKE
jgi:hypothetical protein